MKKLTTLILLLLSCNTVHIDKTQNPQAKETPPSVKEASLPKAKIEVKAPILSGVSIEFQTLQNTLVPVLHYTSDSPSVFIKYRACGANPSECASGVLLNPDPSIMNLPEGHFHFYYTACNVTSDVKVETVCSKEASLEGDFHQATDKKLPSLLAEQDTAYQAWIVDATQIYALVKDVNSSYQSCTDKSKIASISTDEATLLNELASLTWNDFSTLAHTDGISGKLYDLVKFEFPRANKPAAEPTPAPSTSGSIDWNSPALKDLKTLGAMVSFVASVISFGDFVFVASKWLSFLSYNRQIIVVDGTKTLKFSLSAIDSSRGTFHIDPSYYPDMPESLKGATFFEDPYTRKIYYTSERDLGPLENGKGHSVRHLKIPDGYKLQRGIVVDEAGKEAFIARETKQVGERQIGDFKLDTDGSLLIRHVEAEDVEREYQALYRYRYPNDPKVGNFLQRKFGSYYRVFVFFTLTSALVLSTIGLGKEYEAHFSTNLADTSDVKSTDPCTRTLEGLDSYTKNYLDTVQAFVNLATAKVNVSLELSASAKATAD